MTQEQMVLIFKMMNQNEKILEMMDKMMAANWQILDAIVPPSVNVMVSDEPPIKH